MDWKFAAGGLILFFQAYLTKKAQNLATKEDIDAITKKIEAVKHEYSTKLEGIRGLVQSQLFIHQTRYKTEFEILSELAKRAINLRDAALSLRPQMEWTSSEETEEDKRKNRLIKFHETMRAFYEAYEPAQPFYPEQIYQVVRELDLITRKEVVQFRHGAIDRKDPKYWDQAQKNAEDIIALTDKLLAAIRTRTKEWENFGSNPGQSAG